MQVKMEAMSNYLRALTPKEPNDRWTYANNLK